MADSEAVVAQTSAMTAVESAGFPSVHNDANLDASGAGPAATRGFGCYWCINCYGRFKIFLLVD